MAKNPARKFGHRLCDVDPAVAEMERKAQYPLDASTNRPYVVKIAEATGVPADQIWKIIRRLRIEHRCTVKASLARVL